ncbi:MAG: sulfatase, partial [Acidobacteriota bacterium]
APAGTRLRVEIETERGDRLEKLLEARAPRGEVVSEELSMEALSGQRARLRFQAEGSDLFVSPRLVALKPIAARASRGEEAADLSFLLIVLDGAHAGRMSAYGYSRPTTPNIDVLAERSVVFERAMSQAVYTIASIGSLLTGQYPEQHQSVSFADRLPSSAVTFPGLLTLGGLRTVGFSGNAVVSSAFGLDSGYETFHAAWKVEDYSGHGDSVLRLFEDWLEGHSWDRFFAYVHFREPHFPYNPPPPFDRRFGPGAPFPHGLVSWQEVEAFNRAAFDGETVPNAVIERIRGLYDGNMAYVDSLVGRILERLEAKGVREHTAVILTADHGEALFEHQFIGHNTQLYDESIWVPLMVSLPGLEPRRVREVVELIDLAPTVLELAGLGDDPALRRMQGRSLLPVLRRGESLPGRMAFSRTVWDKARYSVRDDRFKLIWDSRTGATELYELTSDPGERVNLVGEWALPEGFYRQQLFGWLRAQEHLRGSTPTPDKVLVPADLRRYLGTLGYAGYLDKREEKKE